METPLRKGWRFCFGVGSKDALRAVSPRLVLRQAQDEALRESREIGLILSLSKDEAVLTGASYSPAPNPSCCAR